MDTTINYQALALEIIMAAVQDAQGEGQDAREAQQWLDVIDVESLGMLPMVDQIDPSTFLTDYQQ